LRRGARVPWGPHVVSGIGVAISEDTIERRISERDQAIERMARLNGIETIRSAETTVLVHFARWRAFDQNAVSVLRSRRRRARTLISVRGRTCRHERLSAVGGRADKSSPIFGGPRDHDFSIRLVSAVSIGPNNRQRMSGLHERTLAWPSRTSIRTYGIWHRLQLCKPVHTG
jgi:hypothetical protein